MISLLNSAARWTAIRAAGLAVVAAAVFLPAANAEATCMVMSGVRVCAPSSSINPLTISIGNDSTGQFIAYQDTVTGGCTWDMIGNTSAFYNDTVVTGTSQSDTMRTVPSNEVICGIALTPPSPGGRALAFRSGGGYDYMLSYLGSTATVQLSCQGYNEGCYFEMWGPGSITGGDGTDYVVKKGAGDWYFSTNNGNDWIYNYGSGLVTLSDCGFGTDFFGGPWDLNTRNCELR